MTAAARRTELVTFITAEDVMRSTGLPRSTVYQLMDKVAAKGGLDLSTRATRAKLLPLALWQRHAEEVLTPHAVKPEPRPARPPQKPRAVAHEGAPTVALPAPRTRRAKVA